MEVHVVGQESECPVRASALEHLAVFAPSHWGQYIFPLVDAFLVIDYCGHGRVIFAMVGSEVPKYVRGCRYGRTWRECDIGHGRYVMSGLVQKRANTVLILNA